MGQLIISVMFTIDVREDVGDRQNVTGFGKTLRMGSACDSRNARF